MRPSEFFAKYYDNEDPIFNPNFTSPAVDRQSRFSRFKSPLGRTDRSKSPIDRGNLVSIMEERETGESNINRIGDKARPSFAPRLPVRYSSQARFHEAHSDSRFGRRTFDYDSPRSLGRISDTFYGQNRYMNQPNQRSTQRAHMSRFMEDEIIRLNKYTHIRNSNKK
jgi:hypothetical protein